LKLRVLTLNLHKGFSTLNGRFVLDQMRKAIRSVDADIVFLQEVHGEQPDHRKLHSISERESQVEYLADEIWPQFSYGRNSVTSRGDHGNAILSKFKIRETHNTDLSLSPLEKRGLLYCKIQLEEKEDAPSMHLFTAHLNLLATQRRMQWNIIEQKLESLEGESAPLIFAGDLNDWSLKLHREIESRTQLREAFASKHKRMPKTFPSGLPIMPLDRIYSKGLETTSAEVLRGRPWSQLSDHLPLIAEFSISGII